MKRWTALGLVIGITLGPAALAQDADEAPPAADEPAAEAPNQAADEADQTTPDDPAARPGGDLPITTVIGSREAAFTTPGAAHYVDTEELRRHSYDDINRVARRVPGVYFREEDGFGLMPNISLRGVDLARSAKITIMEDGVLMAPAPYSAPAAYFSPTAGRMSAIEVLKGSSQVRYGPHTTGGVINYLATPIPESRSGYLKTLYGDDSEIRVHGYYGDVFDTDIGRFSFLLEGFARTTEGFKDFDNAPDFRNRNADTGFTKFEPMLKVAWEPDGDVYHRFEFKAGHTDLDADIGYLGLSEADFARDPFRLYPAARFDNIITRQTRLSLSHYMEPSDALSIQTTAYYNRFQRDWLKLHDLRNIDDGMGGTTNQSLSNALAGGNGGRGLGVLRGERAGDLRVRSNNRKYGSYGVEVVPTWHFDLGPTDHELRFGVRYHADRIRRFQRDDIFSQADNGAIIDSQRGEGGSGGNRRQKTQALALHAEDAISFGRWTVTPGIRFEHLWQDWTDFASDSTNTVVEEDDGTMSMVGGGVGLTYDWTEEWTLFGGVHRGFSPPSPRAALRNGLREETSLAFEAGARYRTPRRSFVAEATGFFTRFDDLIAIENIGGVASGEAENIGRVNTAGVELRAEYDPGIAFDWGFRMPNFVSFTYTDARLRSDTGSDDPGSIFAGGRRGNRLPHIPEFLVSAGTGIEVERFGFFVTGSFVDEVFTTASNTRRQVDATGEPDARFGTLDSHFIVDIEAHYRVHDNVKLLGGVHNVFDEIYLAARHPHGPRPGRGRFAYVGLEIEF